MPRTATVVTTRETQVFCLQTEPFVVALTGHRPARDAATDVVSRRLEELRSVDAAADV